MSNIMNQVKLKNHTSRDGFDLTRKNAFTAKIGELLPVACIECLPGDSFKGVVQHFTRTMPVSTAAYTRMREYYDWFFVPTNLLWNKFNSFVTQMTDNNQHALSITTRQQLTDTHPYFTTNQLHQYLVMRSKDSVKNIFGFSRGDTSAKLLNYLGYGDFSKSIASDADANTLPYRENVNLNPFPLLAYQKIYQDFYRHSQWEKAFAPAFNIDYLSGASNSLNIPVSSLLSSVGDYENMFELRYANWNKDLFMGVLPNSQYGAAASVVFSTLGDTTSFAATLRIRESGSTNTFPSATNLITTVPETSTDGVSVNGVSVSGSSALAALNLSSSQISSLRTSLGLSLNSDFSILALRQAEALQKWKEVTQSQQQDYKNQIEAHFGVSPDDAYSERCRWIDGSVSNLDISEVVNQNITSTNAADIAGKGVGVGESKFNFKTDVHGYLMCIYHCVPLLDYAISGVNRTNLKTKVTDYAIPEFDRTGMVSVPLIELSNTINSNVLTGTLLGYAPRYYDYKQAIDEVHGAFVKEFSPWVAPVSDAYIQTYLNKFYSLKSLNYIFFKVNPATLNPIFGYNVDSSVDSDQLLVNASFDLKAVRNLDRNGLPY